MTSAQQAVITTVFVLGCFCGFLSGWSLGRLYELNSLWQHFKSKK